jgi:hypothetical protein
MSISLEFVDTPPDPRIEDDARIAPPMGGLRDRVRVLGEGRAALRFPACLSRASRFGSIAGQFASPNYRPQDLAPIEASPDEDTTESVRSRSAHRIGRKYIQPMPTEPRPGRRSCSASA